MKNSLKGMQDVIMKYVEVISKVLRIDVEVIDKDLVRVAGTGIYSSGINDTLGKESYLYDMCMENKKTEILVGSIDDGECEDYFRSKNLNNYFEMSSPIILGDEVLGAIGLVALTSQQRTKMINDLDIYTSFFEQVADLMALDIKSERVKNGLYNEINCLKSILLESGQGILVIDSENKVDEINNAGIYSLSLKEKPECVLGIRQTGNELYGYEEFEVELEDKSVAVLGKKYSIEDDTNGVRTILIYNDVETLNKFSSRVNKSMKLEDMEKEYIAKALDIYGTSSEGKEKAAKELGIGIATLYRKINKYGL